MTSVTIDKSLTIDLIRTKKRLLSDKIQKILDRWNQPTTSRMIELTKEGKLPEAENFCKNNIPKFIHHPKPRLHHYPKVLSFFAFEFFQRTLKTLQVSLQT